MFTKNNNPLYSKIFIIWVACLSVVTTWSQEVNMPVYFDRLTFKDGLSHNTVFSILQDQHGYIWIGTQNGLNKYDGYSFETFQSNEFDNNKIGFVGKTIRSIFEDSKGNLWIGTKNAGVNIKLTSSDEFVNLQDDPVFEATKAQEIRAFHEDTKGNIWIATLGNGLIKYNSNTNKSSHYTNKNSNLSNDFVFDIVEDQNGTIWVGTQGGGINYLTTTDTFEQVYVNQDGMSDFWDSYSKTLLIDGDDLWIGTEGTGLYKMNLTTRQFQYFGLGNTEKNTNSNLIRAIHKTSTGLLYIATDGGGLNVFNPKTQTISKYNSQISNPLALNTNALYCVHEDQDGDIWIGTYNGGLNIQKVNKTFFNHPSSSYYLKHPSILSVCEDQDKKIWFGTDGGGLNWLDPEQNHLIGTNFLHDPNDENSILDDVIKTILKDQQDRLWLGTYGKGISVYDPNTKLFKHYKNDYNKPKSLSNNIIWSMAERENGEIWIGTLGGGISVFNPQTDDFTNYNHAPSDSTSVGGHNIKAIFVDTNDRVWIGTDNSGLNRWNENTKTFEQFTYQASDSTSISSNEIRAIAEDANGDIWIGTESRGLNRYLGAGRFERITKKDGLIDNSAMGITLDQDGLLWISTFEGISQLNPETLQFRNFDFRNSGNSNQFNQEACLTASDGTLYFGGVNGLHAIKPSQVKELVQTSDLIFTDFSLFNKKIIAGQKIDGKVILEQCIEETKRIDLTYLQNSFSIAFAAIDYTNPRENTFSYKMDGFDTNWQLLPPGQHNSSYTNLDSGNYIFRVKHKNTVAALQIIIHPPFWKTWWFELLTILIFIGLILGFIRFIIRRKEAAYQQKMLVAERKILQLENEKLANEVDTKNSELLYSAVQMAHKNELLTNIKEELKENPDAEKKLRRLLRTVDQELKDEDYWKEFNLYFNQVDKNFVQALVAKHPKLTQNDIRICTLMRIQLSTKEIASLLNVSVRAVEQSRYRLKKRLGLESKVNLSQYIMQFRGK